MYLEHGRVEIDLNRCEGAMMTVALGWKNWLLRCSEEARPTFGREFAGYFAECSAPAWRLVNHPDGGACVGRSESCSPQNSLPSQQSIKASASPDWFADKDTLHPA